MNSSMKDLVLGVNNDYACAYYCLNGKGWIDDKSKIQFYYGYETQDPDTGEWCFVASKKEQELVRYTRSQLLKRSNCDLNEPIAFMIAGIMLFLDDVSLITYNN